MSNCTRQELVLQTINDIQATLDTIVNLMDNDSNSLVQLNSKSSLVELMKTAKTKIELFHGGLVQDDSES